MPTFDRWGLLREGKVSREKNPNRRGTIVESEEDTAGSAGPGQDAACRTPKSKKRPASVGSGTASVYEERTESADTPPPADSPRARPADDAEAQSSSRALKRARLGDVGNGSGAPAKAVSPTVEFSCRERSARSWTRAGR